MEQKVFCVIGLFAALLGLPAGQWVQAQSVDRGLQELYSPDKAQFCQTVGNQLCLSAGNDIVLTLLGCATGLEDPLGFPPFEINVPPGEDLAFTIFRNPDAIHNSFLIISEEAANNRFLDLCVDTDPGIFTEVFPIQPSNDPNPIIQVIPSAAVDAMKAASDVDGFVVMISQACPDTLATFAGVRITRNPSSVSPLEIRNIPELVLDPIEVGQPTFVEFEVENSSTQPIQGISFDVRGIFGNPIFTQLTIDGIPCQTPQNCVFDIGPLQIVTIVLDLTFTEPGLNYLTGFAQGDGCGVSTLAKIKVRPSTSLFSLIGKARAGLQASSILFVSNPGTQPADVSISATDDQGRATSLDTEARRLGRTGPIELTVQPGQTQYVDISQSGSSVQRFMVHLSSTQFVFGQVRQQYRGTQPGDVKVLGTTAAMQNYYEQVDASGSGLVPVKVVETDNKKFVISNYNLDPTMVTITIRDASSGAVKRQLSGVVTETLGINVVPLVAGLDENAIIEVDGGPGILVELEYCGPEVFQIVTMRRPPSASSKMAGLVGTGDLLAQPFYQPDVNDTRYEPSTYSQVIMSTMGLAVPAGQIDLSFDEDCGVGTVNDLTIPTLGSPAGLPTEEAISQQGPLVGGFGLFDESDLMSSIRWQEGARAIWILDTSPVTEGRIFIPEVTPFNDPNPEVSDMAFQVMSDDPLMLTVGVFNADGQLLSFQGISLPAGGHLLCASDFDIDNQAAFLEFQVPEYHLSPVWISALADQPEVFYRDQLPIMPLVGGSILSQIGDVFAAWNGSAPSCLGLAPSMADLVDFVNNNFMCPAAP